MKPLTLTQADFANLSLLAHDPLQRLLERSNVVSSDSMPPGVVTMNTLVRLSGETDGLNLVRVVYPADADAARRQISVTDPLGTALLGTSAGDVIEADIAPGSRRVRVEEIVYQPERSLRYGMVVNEGKS
jgi:regulator of nucleoside diphosphate kinase